MAAAQALKAVPWTPEAVEAFAPCCDTDPFGPLLSPRELLHDSYLHEYHHGLDEALIAIKRHVTSGGCRVHLQGLVNMDKLHPLRSGHLMQSVEALARAYQADVLTMCTQHKAMAAACGRWGGHISGAVIAKYLV